MVLLRPKLINVGQPIPTRWLAGALKRYDDQNKQKLKLAKNEQWNK